jgi:hypothetical protein
MATKLFNRSLIARAINGSGSRGLLKDGIGNHK